MFIAYAIKTGVDNSRRSALIVIESLRLFQQKIEVIDEVGEYGDDEDDDLLASDLDQMQSMLEFKVNTKTGLWPTFYA